jgi:uncharacterized protein
MQIESGAPPGAHRITAYDEGHFVVDDRRYQGSIVVTPTRVLGDWAPRRMEDLDAAAMAIVEDLDCEVVLLGTGREHRFPAIEIVAPLMARGIGVEVMTSDAACRTYNILMSEGRRVAALLLVIE